MQMPRDARMSSKASSPPSRTDSNLPPGRIGRCSVAHRRPTCRRQRSYSTTVQIAQPTPRQPRDRPSRRRSRRTYRSRLTALYDGARAYLVGLTWAQKRNVLLTVTGTVMCARVSEPAGLRVCNVYPDVDVPFDPRYQGGIGIKIVERKNDTKRCGIMDRRRTAASASTVYAGVSTGGSLPILSTAFPKDSQTKDPSGSASGPPSCNPTERDQRRQGLHSYAGRRFPAVFGKIYAARRPLYGHQRPSPRTHSLPAKRSWEAEGGPGIHDPGRPPSTVRYGAGNLRGLRPF